MNNSSEQAIQLQINKLKNLPVLPEASVKILEAINNPDISIDKLAEVLSLSPGLVARLLGLANSAYFGQSRQVNDIRTAIFQVLGLDLVKSLAMGIVLNVQFDTRKCSCFDTEYFWMRSLATAVAGQKLAVANDVRAYPPSTIYNCGLLLYIGLLVLAYLMPDELNVILFRTQQKQNLSVGKEIIQQLGLSHYQMGYQLLKKWQLSPVYQSVLNSYEIDALADDEIQIVSLLRISQLLSSLLLDNKNFEAVEFETLAENSSLSIDSIAQIFNELLENKQNIQQLALIMAS